MRSAAAECGQGIVTVEAQIARSELGIDQVAVAQPDTSMGDAGSSSASRQTWMTGGAVLGACREVRRLMLEAAGARLNRTGRLAQAQGRLDRGLRERRGAGRASPTCSPSGTSRQALSTTTAAPQSIDPETGQGDAHIAYAFAAHRAVVDVDVELGLVRVVELRTAQDVGKAINPLAVTGQIEGGTAQGLGLALLEEIQIVDGKVKNPSFTDYLIPTMLDMPPVIIDLLELPHPDSPYGLNGVGEPPEPCLRPRRS